MIAKKGKSSIERQMEKIFRHTRQGSFKTRARYRDSCRSFVQFVHQRFKTQNLRNIQDKHVVAYIQHRQAEGIAAKTIKNDLAAIRYMNDQVGSAKHELSDNKELKQKYGLELGKTPRIITGNRAWTNEEYQKILQVAEELGNDKMKDVLKLCRTMGLRIAEATCVSRAQVEHALRTGVYQVKGEAKNGKHREVPLSEEAKEVFKSRLEITPRGQRLFIEPNEKTHEVIQRFEKFLSYHRDKAVTQEGIELRTHTRNGEKLTNELTFHGLRYCYVQERMEQEIARGLSEEQAASIVTKEVGHERTEVIQVYTAGK